MSAARAQRSPDGTAGAPDAGAPTAAESRASRARPERIVQDAGLPEPLADIVLRTVGRTRLWRGERADVARELCAHFLDGLEAGKPAGELAQDFGDPRAAAHLIARSRRRQRPWPARALRASFLGAVAVLALAVGLYAVLALRLLVTRAHIARDYIAELNAASLVRAGDEPAWPELARARVDMGQLPEFMGGLAANSAMVMDSPEWPQVVAWLDGHRAHLARVREAAARPALGFRYGTLDPGYERIMALKGVTITPEMRQQNHAFHDRHPPLFGLLLPYLGELNVLSRMLNADAQLAAQRGDGATFVADIQASLDLARLARSGEFLVSQLVQSAIAHRAYNSVLLATQRPDFMDQGLLRSLAHSLAGFANGRLRLDLGGERIMVDDLLQRSFSDDGEGNGYYLGDLHLDAAMSDVGRGAPGDEPSVPWTVSALRPVGPLVLPSRQEIRTRMDRVQAEFARDEALPPWRAAERTSDAAHQQVLTSWPSHILQAMRTVEVRDDGRRLGHFARALESRDLAETHRDAALVALACLAYRADRGAWPATLSELVPAYLPTVPLDPFTGSPLCYRLLEGAPILYSVGADGVDDGGVEPVNDLDQARSRRLPEPGQVLQGGPPVARGDWRLWQGTRAGHPRS